MPKSIDDQLTDTPQGENAIKHTLKAFATAEHAIHMFLSPDGLGQFKKVSYGASTLLRGGEKRTVQFVELTDETDVTLRIEVYPLG